jgi:hypothetical protein
MEYRRRVFLRISRSQVSGTPLSDARIAFRQWVATRTAMNSIGRSFDRGSSSIYPLLVRTGGIRPPDRIRSRLALTLIDREEISRGFGRSCPCDQSLEA